MTAPERNLPPDSQAWGRYIEKRITELSKAASLASSTARAATARTAGAARNAAEATDRAAQVEQSQTDLVQEVIDKDESAWAPVEPEAPQHNHHWYDVADGNVLKIRADYGEYERINYVLNPSFRHNTVGWSALGGSLTRTWNDKGLLTAEEAGAAAIVETQGRAVVIDLPETPDDEDGEGGSPAESVGVLWTASAELELVESSMYVTATLEVIDSNDEPVSTSGPVRLEYGVPTRITARPLEGIEGTMDSVRVALSLVNEEEPEFEVTVDDVILEAADYGDDEEQQYFDGSMPGALWQGDDSAATSWWDGEPRWIEAQDNKLKQELYSELEGLDADLTDLYETVLPNLRDRLDTLRDETLPALDARVQEAEDILGPMPGRLEAAEQAVADAESAASQAATDAAAALTTAADAEQAALDAAGIAEGKGQVITQVSAPTGSRARAENLWVRLPDHKVHIYDEDQSKWVAATDPDLITAAGEAAQALQDAADAATAAQDAATAAQDAQDRAEALEGQVGTLQDDLAAAEAEIATVRDTTIPALNADLATLRDTTVPNLEAIVGPLPQQIADAQAAADDAQAEAETKASTEWVLSRGTDLVTNGTGYMGDNTNFSTFDEYDPTDAPTGARGSFVIVSDSRPSERMIDEHLPVTPSRRYLLSIMAREQNPDTQGESRFYVGLVPYDAQGVQIGPQSYSHDPLTMTVLTAPLNLGDTTVTVESTENFGRLSASSYVGIWGWTDPDGRTWEPGTYTRDYPRIESIVGNVIHLESPFQGAPRPVGTPVSNNRAGGTYMYAVSNKYASLEWERATGVFGGIHDTTNGAATRSFPPATASVKIVWLPNYQGATGSRQAFSAVSFSDATAALAEAEAAQAAADAAQADVDALEGQVGTLQTALGEAEDAVDELRDVTLPGLNTRLDDVEYDQRNFSAEWITAGTLDTDRLNANAVAAAVASFLELHANQITAGLIQGSQINAESIAGAVASFLELNANQITAGEIGADRINVNDLAAAVATVITLNADRITSGEIGAARINTTELAVALATILSLDAGRITSGTIDTDRLNASEIGAAVGEFVSLSADQITAVGAGFNSVVANRMFADIFATNSITADHADLNSLAAGILTANAVKAEHLDANAVKARNLDVEYDDPTTGNMLSIQPDGLRLWGENDTGEPTISLTTSESQQFAILDPQDNIVAGMASDGTVLGTVGTFDELRVGGTDLMEVLDDRPRGVIYNRNFSRTRTMSSMGGHSYITFDCDSARSYRITARLRYRNRNSTGISLRFTDRTANRGSTPTVPGISTPTNIVHDISYTSPDGYQSGSWMNQDYDFIYSPPGSGLRTASILAAVGPIGDTTSDQVEVSSVWWTVEDVGPNTNVNSNKGGGYSTSGGGGGTNPTPEPEPKRTYTRTFTSSSWRTFQNVGTSQESVASSSVSGPLQGQTPYYTTAGRYATHFYFNSSAIRSAIGNGTVLSVRVRPRVVHSHSGSGGTVRMYRHGYDASSSSWGSTSYIGETHFARGERRWLGATSDPQGWATGSNRGIGFYSGGSTSSSYYVQFATSIELEIKYEK